MIDAFMSCQLYEIIARNISPHMSPFVVIGWFIFRNPSFFFDIAWHPIFTSYRVVANLKMLVQMCDSAFLATILRKILDLFAKMK